MRYEYKVIPAPTRNRRRQQKVDGLDLFSSTVSDLLTEEGLEGWSFVGAEHLREHRRSILGTSRQETRTFLIFGRPLQPLDLGASEPESKPVEPPAPVVQIKPRRVQRPDLIEKVVSGERRLKLSTPDTDQSNCRTETGNGT